MSEPSLHDKVVIVTGGSSGIGLAAARGLARGGARPVLFARSAERLGAACAQFRVEGIAEPLTVPVDVRRAHAVTEAVEQVLRRCGRIDALVNNAGIMLGDRSLLDLDPRSWRRIIETNLNGAWFCTRAVLPQMHAQGAGVIINISSGAAVRTGFLNIAYGVSKAGLDRMTQGVAAEVDGTGLVCLSLSPPYTDTEAVRRMFPERNVAEQAAPPEDTARAIAGLLAGDARRYHGRVISVREYLNA